MKKMIYITFILFFLLTALHNTGEAALKGNLVTVPESNVINSKGEMALEISPNHSQISGIVKLNQWLQLGAMLNSTGGGEMLFSPLAKILIINEYNYGVDLSAGLRHDDFYLVAGRSFEKGLKGHLGLGNGSMNGIFLGVSKYINAKEVQIIEESETEDNNVLSSIPPLRLSAEYIDHSINFSVRTNIHNNLLTDLSLINFDRLKVGLSYSF